MTRLLRFPHRRLIMLLALALARPGIGRAAEPASHGTGLQRLARLEAPPSRRGADATGGPEVTQCQALLASDPAAALDEAHDWAGHGGGDAAAQCAALAQVALGDPAQGASALDALSQPDTVPASRRARLADEAVQAWLLAGEPERALRSARRAVALAPGDDELLADRGRAAVAAGDAADAVSDLTMVLTAHPHDVEALVARATAYRRLERLEPARSDIEAACALVPDEPDALLERGILRERMGDAEGARTDWSRILSLSPDTHEADLAQQDLALLDAGPDAR